jgi:coenzyme F420-reducing hydrogenase delta subunit
MKKEFNLLKGLLFDSNTYSANGDCNWSEVSDLLEKLGDKIVEVEKRIECAVRSAQEANDSISMYTQKVDNNETFQMDVRDHDSILRGTNDVMIALDLDDDMCVVDNWYNLFQVKQEVFVSFESSWGTLTCDKDGNVIEVIGDECEGNYLYDITKIDLVEYGKFLNSIGQKLDHDADDILSVGFWKKDGKYEEADHDWRKRMFIVESDKAPTMLCQDESKNSIVQSVISYLRDIEVDGETMEYILRQVGMEEQMLKQLFAQSTNDEIDYLHDVRNGKG